MLLFPIPPEARQEQSPYAVCGLDADTGQVAEELLIVPQDYAGPVPEDFPGTIFWDTPEKAAPQFFWPALGELPLKTQLEHAVETFGQALWLVLQPVCVRYSLPCGHAPPETLTPDAFTRLRSGHPDFYSPELGCSYCILPQPPQIILFDTAASMDAKLRLAESTGAARVVYFLEDGLY